MDVFKDRSWVMFRGTDDGYNECLNAFLDHVFATSTNNYMITCPCSICANCFYHEREIVRGHLMMKEVDADYQKCI